MKKLKGIVFMMAILLTFQVGSVSTMAAASKTPASIVAALTGKSIEDVIQERMDTGKTYGRIAKDNGKLDEFKKESLKLKEEILKEDVANGFLSQTEADSILARIKANQAICDGNGANRGYGCGYGNGNGKGYGNGRGNGNGKGYGNGNGRGCGNGGGCGAGRRAF